MPRGNQLVRQWRLLHLLGRPAGVAVETAAQELGCTVRTIRQDLRVPEDAGFPIYDEPGADVRRSLWKIREDFKLRLPLKLSLSELAALIMSRALLGRAAARVADTLEVRRWILGFGREVEVMSPVGLKEALKQEAEVFALKFVSDRMPLAQSRHQAFSACDQQQRILRWTSVRSKSTFSQGSSNRSRTSQRRSALKLP